MPGALQGRILLLMGPKTPLIMPELPNWNLGFADVLV